MYEALFKDSGISLDRLRTLCHIDKEGGITRAASVVAPSNVTAKQAQFSRQIKELESFFNVDLLDRDVQPYRLTREGKRLAEIAHEMLGKLNDFVLSCGDRPVRLTMGAGESLIQWMLMPLLDDFRTGLPTASIALFNRRSTDIAEGLLNGDIDLGIIRKTAITKQLEGRTLGSFGYRLYVPNKMRKKLGETVHVRELEGIRLALLEGKGEFRSAINDLAEQAATTLNVELECSSSTQVAYAVSSLGYAGILPEFAAPVVGKEKVSVHKIKGFSFKRTMAVVWNPRRADSLPLIKEAAMVLKRLAEPR